MRERVGTVLRDAEDGGGGGVQAGEIGDGYEGVQQWGGEREEE